MRRTNALKVTVGSGRSAHVFNVPVSKRQQVEKFIFSQEIQEDKPVPAEKVLPILIDDTQRPATMLRASRYKADMTQKTLATVLKIKQPHLSEMENGKRLIGKKMAHRLADVFHCNYRVFL